VTKRAVKRGRGRPRALSMGSADSPSQRQFDDLLADIIRTTHRHPVIDSVRDLTAWLRSDFPDAYRHRSYGNLRLDVTRVMHWAASRLYRFKLFLDDVNLGLDKTTGLFDEAILEKAFAAAQARPLRMTEEQFQETLKRLRALPEPH
jgi:hypothetical protein